MQAELHPQYYPEVEIQCSCGAKFKTGSTLPQMRVETCSQCHSFYTGQKKFTDEQGTIEKFQQRMQKTKKLQKKIYAQQAKDRKTQKKAE